MNLLFLLPFQLSATGGGLYCSKFRFAPLFPPPHPTIIPPIAPGMFYILQMGLEGPGQWHGRDNRVAPVVARALARASWWLGTR